MKILRIFIVLLLLGALAHTSSLTASSDDLNLLDEDDEDDEDSEDEKDEKDRNNGDEEMKNKKKKFRSKKLTEKQAKAMLNQLRDKDRELFQRFGRRRSKGAFRPEKDW